MGALTVKLPSALEAKLDALVRRRGQRKSVVVREAIERFVAERGGEGALSVDDLLSDLKGAFKGPKDLSSNPKYMKGFGE